MKKFKLFSEFKEKTIYGTTLADAVQHATIRTAGSYDRELQKVVDQEIIYIDKILGYDDTSQSTRGGKEYETVIVQTVDGKRLSIDAYFAGDITSLRICPADGNREVRP